MRPLVNWASAMIGKKRHKGVKTPISHLILDTDSMYSLKPLRYDHNSSDSVDDNSLFYHRLIEACKFGYGLRHMVSDDNFNSSEDFYNILKSPDIINEYKEKISDDKVYPTSYYGSKNFVEDNGTSHISIVGSNGDAVAVTSSIGLIFGGRNIGEKTGIFYNNHMNNFSYTDELLDLYPSHQIQPDKRPNSSMIPTIALSPDKNVRLVTGASGGLRIISGIALSTASNLILNENIYETIEKPRVHNQLFPNEVKYEENLNSDIKNSLSSRGHDFSFMDRLTSIQAISRLDDGRLHAVCDKLKGGKPYGV